VNLTLIFFFFFHLKLKSKDKNIYFNDILSPPCLWYAEIISWQNYPFHRINIFCKTCNINSLFGHAQSWIGRIWAGMLSYCLRPILIFYLEKHEQFWNSRLNFDLCISALNNRHVQYSDPNIGKENFIKLCFATYCLKYILS
jgi:hypothetical protein